MRPHLSWVRRLAAWLCGRGDAARGDDLVADVAELYAERRARQGRVPAGTRAVWDVITLLLRPAAPKVAPSGSRRNALMPSVRDEARQAWRSVVRRPFVSLSAMLMLALGVALTLLTFTVVDGVLLRPLPFPRGERLLAIYTEFRPESGYTFARFALSWPEYLDYQRHSRTVDIAAFQQLAVNLSVGESGPERVLGARTTSSAFRLLAIAPAQGRVFTAAEDEPGAACVAVLSHELWRDRFASARDVIGTTIRAGNQPCEVVGVMPPRFQYPDERARLWLPLAVDRSPDVRGNHVIVAIGRLREGATFAAAEAERATLMTEWARDIPNQKGHGLVITSLQSDLAGDLRLPLRVLGVAVTLVLLIIVANVSNLLLAHGAARRRELAVRQALGANRRRLVGQMLGEGFLIAAMGGTAGALVAWVSLAPLVASYPGTLPRASNIVFDVRIVMIAIAVCVAVGVLVASLPALRLTRDVETAMHLGDRSGGRGPGARTQRTLVAIEVALSVAITVAALLLVQSFVRLEQTPLGFDPSHAVAVTISVPAGESRTDGHVTSFYADLVARVRAEPGVQAAGAISSLPLGSSPPPDLFTIEGRPVPPPSEPGAIADYVMATPGVLDALGAQLVKGRAIAASDTALDAPVAVINETLARQYWRGEDPVGRRIRYPNGVSGNQWTSFGPWITIIGIVGDMRTIRPSDAPRPALYVSHAQRPRPDYTGRTMTVVVRTAVDSATLLSSVRAIARDLDGQSAATQTRTLLSLFDASIARPRFMSGLMGVFAGVSLVIAVLGVYGLVAYGVARRTREIGVRIALGASPRRIAQLVVRQTGMILLVGLPLGLTGAAGLAQWMSTLLFGVRPFDVATYAVVSVVLALAVVAAVIVPARRAMGVDPIIALRVE